MVRNFKGVVKVSDVKEEFDNLLNTINNKIDVYNSSLDIEDIDYNNGGPDLAPYGYTLSVGGLKTVLEAYDGAILGANVLRRSNGQYIVSEGLYIKDGEVLRLPSKTVDGSGDTVYYDPNRNDYSFDNSATTKLYPNGSGNIVLPPGQYIVYEFMTSGHKMITLSSPTEVSTEYLDNRYETVSLSILGIEFLPDEIYIMSSSPLETSFGTSHFNEGSGTLEYIEIPSPYYGSPSINGSDTTVLGTVSVSDLWPETAHFENLDVADFFASNENKWYSAERIGGEHMDAGVIVDWVLPSDVNITRIMYRYGWEIDDDQQGVVQSVVRYYDKNNNLIRTAYPVNYMPGNPEGLAPGGQQGGSVNLELEVDNVRRITISMSSTIKASTSTYNISLGFISAQGNTIGEPSGIIIARLNSNRISRLCNRPNATNESIPEYKMTIESKNSGYVINGNQSLSNSEKGQFFSGSAGRNCGINLFDTQVAYHHWGADRSDSYHEPLNFMFIPKGIANPYNTLVGEVRFAMQKVWNYILKRPSR